MIQAIAQKNTLQQFTKFLVTGGMNTLVDFAVLNTLIITIGLATGDPKFIYFKALAYTAASCNSFVFNKWWVFRNKGKRGNGENTHTESVHGENTYGESDGKTSSVKKEVAPFIFISILGLILNTMISLAAFNIGFTLFPDMTAPLLANIGALSGTLGVLAFNFIAYKFIIFKK